VEHVFHKRENNNETADASDRSGGYARFLPHGIFHKNGINPSTEANSEDKRSKTICHALIVP
jgi:hypothetical protein